MDALRLILLLLGLAIVGFIFFRARRQQGKGLDILRHFDKTFITSFKSKNEPSTPVHPRRDAAIDENDLSDVDGLVAARQDTQMETTAIDADMTTADVSISSGEPLDMMFTIMARQGKLSGSALSAAVHAHGFHFGDMMAFNLFSQAEQTRGSAVCTILNVMEPGSFPDAGLEGIEVPGIILLMQLPGPLEPRTAFDKVLLIGQQLAGALDADLCDEQRNVLTQQGITHLKDKIETYRFKQKVAQIKRRS